MKLYFAPGTISLMPYVALVESGLPFEAISVDEFSKTMEDGGDYRAVNPLGYLPALALDDGTVLLEAAAIAQYVADRHRRRSSRRRTGPSRGRNFMAG